MHSERRSRLRPKKPLAPRPAGEQELQRWLEQVELDDVEELEAYIVQQIDPVEADDEE